MLKKFGSHLVVHGVVSSQFNSQFRHVLAEQRHPRRAIGLFQITPSGQGGTAIEDTDVVQAEKPSLEYILPVTVLAVHPPGEIKRELGECRLEKFDIFFAA